MGLPGSTLGVGCTLCTPLYGGPKGQGPTRPVEVPRRRTVCWVGGPLAAYHGPARLPHSTWAITGHAPPVTSGRTPRTGPNRAAKCPTVPGMNIFLNGPPRKHFGGGLHPLYPPLWWAERTGPNSACGSPQKENGMLGGWPSSSLPRPSQAALLGLGHHGACPPGKFRSNAAHGA